jgi:hypothetical protein
MTKKKDNSPKMRKAIDTLYHKLGLRYNLSDSVIKDIITSQYEFIKEKMVSINFKDIENEEDFDKLKTNFLLKYLGKLYTNHKLFKRVQKQIKLVKKTNKKRWIN